jgi:virginiamycin B lyase
MLYKLQSVRRGPLDDAPDSTWTTVWVHQESADTSLTDPSDPVVFGETSASNVLLPGDASITSTAISGLTQGVYDFQIAAIVDGSLDTAWSAVQTADTSVFGLSVEPTNSSLFSGISIAINNSTSLALNALGVSYSDLWIKRVNNTTGAVVMLPIDHANFSAVGSDATSFNPAGAYIDTDVNLADEYTYYACQQAGVPALDSYWQILGMVTDPDGASCSYFPVPQVSSPTAFQSTVGGVPDIHVEWQANLTTASGFVVLASNGGAFEPVSSVLGTSSEDFDFTGSSNLSLSNGSYTFEVEALANGGETNSNLSTSLTFASGAPAPNGVSTLSVPSETLATINSISLSWSNITSPNFAQVWIEDSTDGIGFQNKLLANLNDLSANLTNLNAGTTYYFRLRGVTSAGVESTISNVVSATTLPDAPANLKVEEFGSTLVQVQFDKNLDPDPNIGYQIYRGVNFGNATTYTLLNSTPLPKIQNNYNGMNVTQSPVYFYDDPTAVEGTNYVYMVSSVVTDSNGNALSDGNSSSEQVFTPPAAVSNLTLAVEGGDTPGIELNWQNNTSDPTAQIVIEYANTTIANSSTGVGFAPLITLANSAASYHFPDATNIIYDPSLTYTFRITVQFGNGANASAYSNIVSTGAPNAPKHVEAVPLSPTAIEVFWDYDDGSRPTDIDTQLGEGYELLNETGELIAWYNSSGTLVGSQEVAADQSSYVVRGLDSTQSYIFRVWTFNIDDAATGVGIVPGGSGWTAPTGILQGRYSVWDPTQPAQSASVSPLAPDSEDSFKLSEPYEYDSSGAGDIHYAGQMTVNTAGSSWSQYDSAGSAIAIGLAGQVIVDDIEGDGVSYLYPFIDGPVITEAGVEPNTFDSLFTESPFPGAYSDPAFTQLLWNYLTVYEDTLTRLSYGSPTASGTDNGILRVPVEERPTISISAGTVVSGTPSYEEFTVTRSGNTDDALRVTYGLAGTLLATGDYVAPSGVVVFAPGSATATVLIQLKAGYSGTLALTMADNDETSTSTGAPYVADVANVQFNVSGSNVTISKDSTGTLLIVSDDAKSEEIPLAGLNSLIINAGSSNENITLSNANGNISLAGGINIQGTGNISLTVSSGTYTFNSDAGASAPDLTIDTTASAAIVFAATQHLAGLTLGAGTTASLATNGETILVVNNLSIASSNGTPTAKLDLNDNSMLITSDVSSANLSILRQQIVAGLNASGGTSALWAGSEGIVSTAANTRNNASYYRYSVGYKQEPSDGTYGPESFVTGDVLVRYTLAGDANLDGKVTSSDLTAVLNHLGESGASWVNGDLDYAPTVDLTSMDDVLNGLGSDITGTNPALVQPVTFSIGGTVNAVVGATYILDLGSTDLSNITSWTINWGDGTIGAPDLQTVTADPLSIPHTYTTTGSYTISATATDANGTYSASNATVNVLPQLHVDPYSGPALFQGVATDIVLAGIQYVYGQYDPSTYTVSINWGDGTPIDTSGTVSWDEVTGDTFEAVGSHAYAEAGTYTPIVTITHVSDGNAVTFEDSVSVTAAPMVGISQFSLGSGTHTPTSLVTDSNGTLWFIDTATNQLGKVTTSGVVTEFTAPVGFYYTGLASAYGVIWATQSNGKIAKLASDGTSTVYTVSTSGDSLTSPTGGWDGNVWFIDAAANTIDEITSSGTVTTYAIPTADSGAINLWDDDGPMQMVFVEQNTGNIGVIAYDGTISEFASGVEPGDTPVMLAPDSSEGVWYADSNGYVYENGVMNWSYNEVGYLQNMTSSSSGLWLLSSSYDGMQNTLGQILANGTINYYSLSNSNSYAPSLVSGPNESVWFILDDSSGSGAASVVGAISPDGTLSEFTIPSTVALQNLIVGYDGSLWATDSGTNLITRIVATSNTYGQIIALPGHSVSTTMASFNDYFNPTATTGTYTVSINWGDGTTSAGTVITSTDPDYAFQVTGNHTYATAGSYTTTVTITEADGSTTSIVGSAWIV